MQIMYYVIFASPGFVQLRFSPIAQELGVEVRSLQRAFGRRYKRSMLFEALLSLSLFSALLRLNAVGDVPSMPMSISGARLVLAVLLSSSIALAQAIPDKPAPTPTIQITSRIVYVDVVVRDSYGRIVRGLSEKDFRLLEDGKPQKIDFFRDHTHDALSAAAAGVHSKDPLSFSNVDASAQAANSVNIILFDFFNTAPQDQLYARKQMIRFLENLPPGRQTALFVLGTHLRMLQSFTGSTDRLLAAAKAMKLETSSVETIGEQQQDGDLAAAFAAAIGARSASPHQPVYDGNILQQGESAQRAVDITKTALDQIGAAVSGYPGRKNLYWLADTFPLYGGPTLEINDLSQAVITNTMSTADMADANRAITTAQIAIYPVSLMGLDASGMGSEDQGMTPTQQMFTARNAMHEMLNNMADTSGAAPTTEPTTLPAHWLGALKMDQATTRSPTGRRTRTGTATSARLR
jgi:VWFA-related protein